MIIDKPQVSLFYLNHVAEILRSRDLSVENWLAEEQLTESALYDSTCLVPVASYCRLVSSAICAAKLPHLGLIVGAQLSINHHGALGFALLNCQSVRHMLALFERYLITRTPLFSIMLSSNSTETRLTLSCSVLEHNLARPLYEVLLTALVSVVEGFSEQAIMRINLAYPAPSYAEKYKHLFKCGLDFDCRTTTIVFANKVIDRTRQHVDRYSLNQAKQFCEQELSSVIARASWRSKVLMQIISASPPQLTIRQVAQNLFISPRSLHRHLQNEGTHFQQIVDETLSSLATQALLRPGTTVKTVAYELGYADVANFRRAFKRWLGMSPQRFLQIQTEKPTQYKKS